MKVKLYINWKKTSDCETNLSGHFRLSSPSLLPPRHSFLPIFSSSLSFLPPHHPSPVTISTSLNVIYSVSGDNIYINRPTLDMVITWSRYLELIIWLHKQLISTLSKLKKECLLTKQDVTISHIIFLMEIKYLKLLH